MTQQAFFISGIFRSGTTLLTRALDAHPQVHAVYQPFTPFFKLLRNRYIQTCLHQPYNPDFPMGIDYHHCTEYRQFVAAVLDKVIFDAHLIAELVRRIEEDIAADTSEKPKQIVDHLDRLTPGNARHVVRQLYEIVGMTAAGGPAAVGMKELWAEEFFMPFSTTLGIRSIHIMRDPRAVCASRNGGKYLADCNMKKYPVLFIVKAWKRSLRYYYRNRQRSRYLFVQYEKLVGNAPETLAAVCRFLNVPLSEKMFDPAGFVDGTGRAWQPNSSFDSDKAVYRSSLDRWRTVLSEEEIGVIEFLCRREMAMLGYERVVPAFGADAFSDYTEDAGTLTDWLCTEPFLLTAEQKQRELQGLMREECKPATGPATYAG